MNYKALLLATLSAAVLAACGSDSDSTPSTAPDTPTTPPVAAAPKNVIFFLGDGMKNPERPNIAIVKVKP